jgi:hypothetical protein
VARVFARDHWLMIDVDKIAVNQVVVIARALIRCAGEPA